MWLLFQILFSKNYWQRLFRRETWRSSGVALRRAHKDKRARKELWRLFVFLLIPFFCLIYIGILLGGGPGAAGVVIGVVMAGLVVAYRRRRPVEKSGPQTLSLSQARPVLEETSLNTGPELRREFADLALLHAVLADRAGSEVFVRTKVLPEGIEVITRQRHLQILREYGLYERLGDVERDLLLLPDGHWPLERIDDVSMTLEPLRLLRWILRVDDFLPVVGSTMTADYKLAGTLVKEPGMVFRGDRLIGIDGLRTAIEAAEQYLYRCWAEGVQRGFYIAQSAEKAVAAREYAGKLAGNEGVDLLLGARIVSQCSDSDVRLATTLALRRAQVLGWVRQRMYGEVESSEQVEGFYLRQPKHE